MNYRARYRAEIIDRFPRAVFDHDAANLRGDWRLASAAACGLIALALIAWLVLR